MNHWLTFGGNKHWRWNRLHLLTDFEHVRLNKFAKTQPFDLAPAGCSQQIALQNIAAMCKTQKK
jgi:hypothetical protein